MPTASSNQRCVTSKAPSFLQQLSRVPIDPPSLNAATGIRKKWRRTKTLIEQGRYYCKEGYKITSNAKIKAFFYDTHSDHPRPTAHRRKARPRYERRGTNKRERQ
jgi:hypothetical protein